MDVAADRDLFNFVDSLGEKGKEKEETDSLYVSTGSITSQEEVEDEVEIDVWADLESALNNWTQRVLDAESKHSRSRNLRTTIEESIHRQQLDGFLTAHDIAELRYITDVWIKLLNAVSCYGVGCEFLKRDIITLLLELYTVKQITSSLFIDTCLKL